MSTFTLTHQVNDDDREELLAGLGAYNRQFISRDNWGPLCRFLTGTNRERCAGE
ncbi:hypothetical protein FHW06_000983 [Pantoea agglomerans]